MFSENFDGVTAPALPAGWTASGSWTTSTNAGGFTPPSSPNMATCAVPGPSAHSYFLTYGTQDTNGGNVTVTATTNSTGTSHNQKVGVTARGSAATLNDTATSCYAGWFDGYNGVAGLAKIVNGAETILASVTADIWTGWPIVSWTGIGSSLSLVVRDNGNGNYLNSAGHWQAGAATCLTVTDSSISGAGYCGLLAKTPGASFTAVFDDWSVSTAGGTVTVLYSADFGSGAEAGSLASRAADAGIESERHLSGSLGGDQGVGTETSLAWLATGDAGAGDSVSLLAAMAGDAATAASASLSSTYAGGFVYAADGGAAAEATLVARLGPDLSLDAEAFAESLVLCGADGGSFDDSAARSILSATVAYTTIDGASGTESAPAPTAWATDSASVPDGAALAGLLGGDLGIANSASSWSATIVACDSATASSAAWWATLLLAVDSATPAELAAAGLVTQGYHIYMSPAVDQPIDYATVAATVLGLDSTTWTSGTLATPGAWSFGVRAFNDAGEEQNLDCAVTVVFDALGRDITNRPVPPIGLRAIPGKGGAITVLWGAGVASNPARRATAFNVYMTAGATLSYAAPIATVQAATSVLGTFRVVLQGLDDVTYTVGVRALNSSGEEPNTNTVAVEADATGPLPVVGLTATAVT